MIGFPNGKINIGLYVTNKRSDGYHDLETVMAPVALHDALEITAADVTSVTLYNSRLQISATENICYKAWALLRKDFHDLPAVAAHLVKNIPAGAGLGGGSSDGAVMLKLLNGEFSLGLSTDQIHRYALALGSDCPFFIDNESALAKGRGEKLQPLDVNLKSYRILLINPGIHISTSVAFENVKVYPAPALWAETLALHPANWRGKVENIFERSVFRAYPAIAWVKEQLYESGALYASMSGSGSTVYGIFEQEMPLSTVFPQHYFITWV